MPFKFNPFSGNFDQTGSGGGASYIDGEEATYNDLSLDAGVAPLNSAWLVRNSSGIWPVSRKQAGIYIRTATAGSSRDADYTYAGTMPDVFSDAVFTLYDDASTTRTGQFNLGSITAGQNRVLTWPDGNGTIALTSDIPAAFDPASPGTIGATTPAAATFTNLTANTRVNLPNTNGTTAGDLYRNANTLRYRDSTNTERLLLNATDNLSTLTNAATARANLGLGGWATLSDGAALGTENLTISDGESPDFIQFTAGSGVFFYGNRAAQFRGALGLGTAATANLDALSDSAFRIADNGDATKKLAFELSGISNSTTRTLTVPDASGTLGWLQSVSSITVSTDHQLTAARNQRVRVNSTSSGSGASVYLPATGNAEGDRLEVACVGLAAGTLSVRTGQYDFTVSASMGLNEQRTFIYTAGAWTVGTVESHTHAGLGPTFASSAFQVTEPSGITTNRLAFSLSGLTAGSTRTLTVPDASGRIQVEGQPIGNTTPAAGSFSTLNATGTTELVNGGTTAGPFRLYKMSSAANANFERLSLRWASDVAIIGTEKLGTGSARPLEFQTDGVTRMTILATGEINVGNLVDIGNGARIGTTGVQLDASASLRFSASNIGSSSDLFITRGGNGILTVAGSSGSFNRLQFGGTTNLFPALKRSSTTLQVRLADDTAYSVLDAQLRAQGTAPATSGATGTAGDIRYDADYIYVCTAANTWKRAAIATW